MRSSICTSCNQGNERCLQPCRLLHDLCCLPIYHGDIQNPKEILNGKKAGSYFLHSLCTSNLLILGLAYVDKQGQPVLGSAFTINNHIEEFIVHDFGGQLLNIAPAWADFFLKVKSSLSLEESVLHKELTDFIYLKNPKTEDNEELRYPILRKSPLTLFQLAQASVVKTHCPVILRSNIHVNQLLQNTLEKGNFHVKYEGALYDVLHFNAKVRPADFM